MSAATAPASARDALAMIQAGLDHLAASDAAQWDPETQALVLRGLEQDEAVLTAARASALVAFTAGQGHCADGDYSPRAWLMHQTGITRAAAAAHTAWARRAHEHRLVLAAMAAGQVSESYARAICGWTDELPADSREAADEILLAAAERLVALRTAPCLGQLTPWHVTARRPTPEMPLRPSVRRLEVDRPVQCHQASQHITCSKYRNE